MGSRTIEGPGSGRIFVTTEEAYTWLHVSEDQFRRLLELEEFSFIRKRKIGASAVYHWFDIVVLGHMLYLKEEVTVQPSQKKRPGEKNSEDATDR